MADPFTAIAAISAVLGVASQVKQAKARSKAEDAQEDARRVEQTRARRENQRLRRQQLRQQRIARADVISSGAGGNVLESSGVQGGAASVVSQGQSNINEIGIQEGFTASKNSFLDEAQSAINSGNRFASNVGIAQGALGLGEIGYNQYKSWQANKTATFNKNNPSYNNVMNK